MATARMPAQAARPVDNLRIVEGRRYRIKDVLRGTSVVSEMRDDLYKGEIGVCEDNYGNHGGCYLKWENPGVKQTDASLGRNWWWEACDLEEVDG